MTGAVSVAVREHAEAHGRRRLALVAAGGVTACELTIDPVLLSDGEGGSVAVGGIGNVATDPGHRRRGLASQLLELAVASMRAEGLHGSLLYGIDGFYERFGWRSCGDERWVRVALEEARLGAAAGSGYGTCRARPMVAGDRARIEGTYARVAERTVGARLRPADGRAWAAVGDGSELTVVERGEVLVGWAWRGRGAVAERDAVARARRGCVVFAELHAVDDDAMVEVLRAAVAVARTEPGGSADELLVGAPEGHPLRRLARAGRIGATLEDEVRSTGGAMLLPFTPRGEGLLESGNLYQFLPDRF